MLEVKGFQLKTKMSEFTLKEFENISSLVGEEDDIDRYLKILSILGMPDDIIYDITSDDIINIINDFNNDGINNKDLTRTIEVNGRTYSAYPEESEFSLKAKDLGMIQSYVKKHPNKYVLYLIALLFKDDQLTRTEHYTDAHIKHKMELFSDLIADDYYQYIVYINMNVVDKIKAMTK